MKPFLLFLMCLSLAQSPCLLAEETNAPTPNHLPPPQAKALEEWSYALALDAASWGCPLVIMDNLRQNDALGTKPKAAPNSIWRMADISTPQLSQEAGYVTPNVNTLYGFGFLDLGREPIILTLPDSHGRFYLVQLVDMWTNAFFYPAGAKSGYKGGKFAIVSPDWKGKLPDGVKRIDAPTRWVLIQPRVHVLNEGDLPGARKVLGEITVQGLSAYLGKPAPAPPQYDYLVPERINPNQPVSALDFKDPLQFWDLLSAAMNENPPPKEQLDVLLPLYRPLGLEIGKKWDRSKLSPLVLKAMAEAAEKIGPMLSLLPTGTIVNGWAVPPPSIGNFWTDYRTRAVTARVGLTANTPSEAIYFYGMRDGEDHPLSGTNRYTLTFQKTPPYIPPGFWSVTMYDATNNYTVPNTINRYSLGSDNAMVTNSDGSLTLTIQAENPGKEHAANWLPAPTGPFYLILRSYAPGEAMIEALSNPAAYTPPPLKIVP